MPTDTTTGPSRRPLSFFYLGRPAALYLYTRQALARMVPRRRGRIINITSQAGAFRWPTVSAYSVSKAAMIKLTENLAIEASRHGISIFSIHPACFPSGLPKPPSARTPRRNPRCARVRVGSA